MIGSERLENKLIVEANQVSTYIYIRRHEDWGFSFRSWKIGDEMIVDFGQNTDDKITMNPLIAIGRQHPHITSTSLSKCDIFDSVSRVSPWHSTMKSENENLVENFRYNRISAQIILELKKSIVM